MASDYHPLYATLWNDDKLEGSPFEERGFFAFCCSNHRVRPSGIYRASDAQLVADTGMPAARVKAYLTDLSTRALVVRDGAWLFVRSYFVRQPKAQNIIKGVEADVRNCTSEPILRAFGSKYPLFMPDLMRELIDNAQLADRQSKSDRPSIGNGSTEQCIAVTEQSITEQSKRDVPPSGAAPPPAANGRVQFKTPESITRALERAPRLGAVAAFRSPAWWQAEIRANPGVDMAAQVLKAEAYLVTHPEKHYTKLSAFLHGWFGRADRET